MSNYQVVEIFSSINGEGQRAGQLALFIRMKGCNMSCSYCDTKWANEPDCKCHMSTLEEIIDVVRMMGIRNVTVTGGEPLIQKDIHKLLEALVNEPGVRVEIETNGGVDLVPFMDIKGDISFTMDYKLPSSGMEDKNVLSNLDIIRENDTVKFVAGNIEDLMRAKEIIDEYDLTKRTHVYLSPVFGQIDLEEMVSFMKTNRLNDVNLQLQMHKIIWDSNMRGV